jgi:hypothetical protein
MSAHHHHPEVGGGAAVLDIGDDVGALLVLMDPGPESTELFLRAKGSTDTIHTGVWTRHRDGGHVTAALFCEVREGTYWVLDDEGCDNVAVVVKGGELGELDLRR